MSDEAQREWIREHMTKSSNDIVDAHKETIAKLVGIGTNGEIMILVDRSKLKAPHLVAIFYIGRLFSSVAGYSKTASATNSEVIRELGMPKGTVGRTVLELRAAGWLREASDGGNEIVLSSIPLILKDLGALVRA